MKGAVLVATTDYSYTYPHRSFPLGSYPRSPPPAPAENGLAKAPYIADDDHLSSEGAGDDCRVGNFRTRPADQVAAQVRI